MSVGAEGSQDELLGVLRELLAKSSAESSWWRQLGDMGVLALAVPEEKGGLGLGLAQAASAFEAIGEALAPGPLVWSSLAAFVLPQALTGEAVIAGVDLHDAVAGDPVVVPHLDTADRLLVLDGRGVVIVDRADLDASALGAPLDPGTPVARLDAQGPGEVLGDLETAERLRRTGRLLTAAALVGVSQGALDVAVAYSKQREQFGRPIGSFQALKHLMADAYARTNLARAAVAAAAQLEGSWQPGRPESDLASAKLLAGRAADANARMAVQVYGGMGFAAETPPHLFLKRAWVFEHEFGTSHEHALDVSAVFAESRP